jgi:hypothetical protein
MALPAMQGIDQQLILDLKVGHYLVLSYAASTSIKAVKAMKLSVTVIPEPELLALLTTTR